MHHLHEIKYQDPFHAETVDEHYSRHYRLPGYGKVYWHLNLKAEEEGYDAFFINSMLDYNI